MGIIKYISAVLFLHWCNVAFTQSISCSPNPLSDHPSVYTSPVNNDSLDASVSNRLDLRRKSLYFHQTLLYMQEPSTLSVPFTSYTFNTSGYQKKPYLLDSDIQIPIALGGKRFVGKRGWMNAVHVLPWFKVRIFQNDPNFPFGPKGDISLAVRTPSMMPGLIYYGAPASWWDPEGNGNGFWKNLFFGVKAFHHSNGQDGYELDTVKVSNNGEINLYNGNFGENLFFEILAGGKTKFIRRNIWNSEGNIRKVGQNAPGKQICLKRHRENHLYWRVGYEFHPARLSSSFFDSLSIYGRYRFNLNVGYSILPTLWEFIGDGQEWCDVAAEKAFEQWRFTLNMNYILDGDYKSGLATDLKKVPFVSAKRLNFWLTSYFILRSSKTTSLFLQAGWYGSDNYNIYFNQSMFQVRGGLAFAFFDLPFNPDKR